MRAKNKNQLFIVQCMFVVTVLICLFFVFKKLGWKMSGESDRVTAEQMAEFYLATSLDKLNDLRGWGTCTYSEASPTGYLCFECDGPPVLKDQNLYEAAGDSLMLTDKFLQQFGRKAWNLLHTKELICLRMKESPELPRRFFLHNKKTNVYFFARL